MHILSTSPASAFLPSMPATTSPQAWGGSPSPSFQTGSPFMMNAASPWQLPLAPSRLGFCAILCCTEQKKPDEITPDDQKDDAKPARQKPFTINPDCFHIADLPLGITTYDGWVPLKK